MTRRPIMDAGPGLNFLSLNKERLLFTALGPLSVPETVETELLNVARREQRFAAAAAVWSRLPDQLLEILSDDATDELASVVHRISGLPFDARAQRPKDLGETMVIAHAVVAAESGEDTLVLIDDSAAVAPPHPKRAASNAYATPEQEWEASGSSTPQQCWNVQPGDSTFQTRARCGRFTGDCAPSTMASHR